VGSLHLRSLSQILHQLFKLMLVRALVGSLLVVVVRTRPLRVDLLRFGSRRARVVVVRRWDLQARPVAGSRPGVVERLFDERPGSV